MLSTLILTCLASNFSLAQEPKLDALEVLEQARIEAQSSQRRLFVHLEAPW